MAGTMSLAIGLSLISGSMVAAIVLEVFLALAVAALVFGRFCLGSFLFLLLRGETDFATHTLPWSGTR
jgi:hypothetical protein